MKKLSALIFFITAPLYAAHAPYYNWASFYGLTGSDAGDSADPDHDGNSNLTEYAYNMNPTIPDQEPRLIPTPVNGYLQITLSRLKEATDVIYIPEAKSDLFSGTWSSDSVVKLSSVERGDWLDETYRLAWPISQNQTGFIRVRIARASLPAPVIGLPDASVGSFGQFVNSSNGPMTITFGANAGDHAELTLFDMHGFEVRKIFDGSSSSGTNSVTWDGKNNDGDLVEPDVYLAVLKIAGNTSVKKIVIIR